MVTIQPGRPSPVLPHAGAGAAGLERAAWPVLPRAEHATQRRQGTTAVAGIAVLVAVIDFVVWSSGTEVPALSLTAWWVVDGSGPLLACRQAVRAVPARRLAEKANPGRPGDAKPRDSRERVSRVAEVRRLVCLTATRASTRSCASAPSRRSPLRASRRCARSSPPGPQPARPSGRPGPKDVGLRGRLPRVGALVCPVSWPGSWPGQSVSRRTLRRSQRPRRPASTSVACRTKSGGAATRAALATGPQALPANRCADQVRSSGPLHTSSRCWSSPQHTPARPHPTACGNDT
jgi:hypothetical protein